jgi:ankyrin repeat protein
MKKLTCFFCAILLSYCIFKAYTFFSFLYEVKQILAANKVAQLHIDSKNGTIEKVKLDVEAGISIECTDITGATPLHYAVLNEKNAIEICTYLIKCGGDINRLDKAGVSPLQSLVRNSCPDKINNTKLHDLIRVLLDLGANINVQDLNGESIVHDLVRYKCLSILKLVKGSKINFNLKTVDGITPLHLAVLLEDEESINFILEKKSKVNVLDSENKTPLDIAIEKGNSELIKILERHGAKKACELEKGSIDGTTVEKSNI